MNELEPPPEEPQEEDLAIELIDARSVQLRSVAGLVVVFPAEIELDSLR